MLISYVELILLILPRPNWLNVQLLISISSQTSDNTMMSLSISSIPDIEIIILLSFNFILLLHSNFILLTFLILFFFIRPISLLLIMIILSQSLLFMSKILLNCNDIVLLVLLIEYNLVLMVLWEDPETLFAYWTLSL